MSKHRRALTDGDALYFDERGGRLCGPDPKWVDPHSTREKRSHPYSYSEFFHWGSREIIKHVSGADYSDRLWQWDHAKMERCWKEHVGEKGWPQASAEELSNFITAYHGKKLAAVAVAEGCNVGNGYPYFILWWREDKS